MKIERLFDLLIRYVSHFPSDEVLCFKRHGLWKTYGIEEIIDSIDLLSIGFFKSGVQPGDRIAIISSNRPEWNIVDFACQQTGAISVPIYINFSEQEIHDILRDADVKFIFVSDLEILKKVRSAAENLSNIKEIFSFDYVEGTRHWSILRSLSVPEDKTLLEQRKRNVKGNDVATIIYTSGTTGKPKGVLLTHHNIISNIISLSQVIPLEPGSQCRILSFLPLSHVFERSAVYMYLYFGCHIYYAENLDSISENLQEVRPVSFTTVPSILEKLYNQIMVQAHSLKGVQRVLFYWAFKLGLRYKIKENQGWWYNLQVKIASRLIFKKFRDYLGGNITYIVSGATSLQPKINRLFWAADLKIL